MARDGDGRAIACCGGWRRSKVSAETPNEVAAGLQPAGGAFDAERKRRGEPLRAPCLEGTCGIREEGLSQQESGVRAHRGQVTGATGREEAHRRLGTAETQAGEQARELILDHIGQGSDHQQ